MVIPTPSTNRPTTNCGRWNEVAEMTVPAMIHHAPENMAIRRPYRSEMTAAGRAPTIWPLCQSGPSHYGEARSFRDSERYSHSIHGSDQRDLGSRGSGMERALKVWHGEDPREQRPVITVCARAEKGDKNGEVELDRRLGPSLDLALVYRICQCVLFVRPNFGNLPTFLKC
jgi:hypothetical protein